MNQVNQDGYHSQMLEGIFDHRKEDSAVSMENKWTTTRCGNRSLRKTTVGWMFKIKWKNETAEWVPLKLMKESNPVGTAEYTVSRKLDGEPAFAWWVPYTLCKRDRIIAMVNSRVRKSTHKYGLEIPNPAEDAIRIDKKNGNTYWQDALNKEMKKLALLSRSSKRTKLHLLGTRNQVVI